MSKQRKSSNTPSQREVQSELMRAALEQIREENGGHLPPEQVIEYAEDPASPLHDFFEWDDNLAAHQFRLAQARRLIRRVKFEQIVLARGSRKIEVEVVRQYESAPMDRRAGVGYTSVDDLMRDPLRRGSLLQAVLKQLQNLRRRYTALNELSSVWNAVADAEVMYADDVKELEQGKEGHSPAV